MLKDKMANSIKANIKDYEKLLRALQCSNLADKDKRIAQCKHALEKQKQMLLNISNLKG